MFAVWQAFQNNAGNQNPPKMSYGRKTFWMFLLWKIIFTARWYKNAQHYSHWGQKKHVCEQCGQAFSGHLNIHKRTHSGDKAYKCLQCERYFSQAGNLKTHKLTHTGEKKFSCEQCGKAFSQSVSLAAHKNIHTGEKGYVCAVQECGNAFKQSSTFHYHKLTHTGEKPLSCFNCDKSFTKQNKLWQNIFFFCIFNIVF